MLVILLFTSSVFTDWINRNFTVASSSGFNPYLVSSHFRCRPSCTLGARADHRRRSSFTLSWACQHCGLSDAACISSLGCAVISCHVGSKEGSVRRKYQMHALVAATTTTIHDRLNPGDVAHPGTPLVPKRYKYKAGSQDPH